MEFESLIPPKSLLFAPMEGVTDAIYRRTLAQLWPSWDRFFCDFLRAPSVGHYKSQKIAQHFGHWFLEDPFQKKNSFQILTSPEAQTERLVDQIADLGIKHLDLNLGCPSKRVNAHLGGAYLLSDLPQLATILKVIRHRFPAIFTVKIRIGYHDDSLFDDILSIIESSGVDALTIHARTRDQMYRGKANWQYIARAVQKLSIPVIGNGDLWDHNDIEEMFHQTNCYAVMCARGALKTPWLAELYKQRSSILSNDAYLLEERKKYIESYFLELQKQYANHGLSSEFILNRFKSLCRYLFEDFHAGDSLRQRFCRSRSLNEFNEHLMALTSC